ncbi:unnamed protein product [Rotaria magnacalcarata]|uniref:Uncharacterized protein n=1 Tax=Rotaria magnacalcarata TaxID=392030 RepID=A0A820EFS6_9BILA|nr:unnamed protein product [Rotaria magnacalcarata]CAF2176453.1 unnamed protein product [Rotaria magnacalcarata]CAF4086915.1 unnamed protein product [Rotaria magnacalcarata]CAF4245622.1 unnamed protein product [Rotaria magnacalcarata]
MNQPRIIRKSYVARVAHVPRRPSSKIKISPLDSTIQHRSIESTNEIIDSSAPSVASKYVLRKPSSIEYSDNNSDTRNAKKLSSDDTHDFTPISVAKRSDLIQPKSNLAHRFTNWYTRLTYKQKIFFTVICAVLITSVLVVTIIPPVYMFVILKISSQSSFTNHTVSSCSSSTCIGQETPYRSSQVTALYTFDGNTNDQSGYLSGTASGSPSFVYSSYVGQAIFLTSSSQQYVQIPNINFFEKSFTLQTWINTGSLSMTNDYGLFSQCDSSSICLSFNFRNGRLVLSFDSMNANNSTLTGSTLISDSDWVHVTAVYDAVLFQQQIYVDGVIDAVSYGIVSAFQGDSTSATTTIGRGSSYSYGTTYYNGKIDHFTISSGVARSAYQIYNDASLVVHYPFDTNGTYNDYSVYLCNGLSSGASAISSGRVNQAISFISSTSYFQSQCFPRMRGAYPSFSFSLWIYPTSTTTGSIVHISSNSDGSGSCYDLLVLTSAGALVFQWMGTSGNVSNARGPAITANTWTHVSTVYGQKSGVRLFINGQFRTSSSNTGSLNLQNTNTPLYITLGNTNPLGPAASLNCSSGTVSISSGSFLGYIDEFRMYNREVDNQEICVLANP